MSESGVGVAFKRSVNVQWHRLRSTEELTSKHDRRSELTQRTAQHRMAPPKRAGAATVRNTSHSLAPSNSRRFFVFAWHTQKP